MLKKYGNTLWLAAIIFASLFPFSACGEPAAKPSESKEKILRIATTPDYPPLIFKKNDLYCGIEAEMAELLAKELQCRIIYVDIPMDFIFSSIRRGKADMIMLGTSVTPERQKQVRFLLPFMTISQMAIVRTEMESKFDSAESIYNTDLRVGFIKGTTGELLVLENLKKASPHTFSTPAKTLVALKNGGIDLLIYDSPYIWNLFNEKKGENLSGLFWPLTDEDLAWAVGLDNSELADRINAIILKWKRNGTITKIINKWIKLKRIFVAAVELAD